MNKKIKVSFQGVIGAYSHLACVNHFSSDVIAIECETFQDAMDMVEANEVDFALIPIENKTAGRVDEFYGLIPSMKLQIVGEHYQKIEHCLLGTQESSLEKIEVAYSHPQGLAQCRNRLRGLNIDPIAKYDTAGSAKEVAHLQDSHIGAIASSLAAKTYGLKILKENMEDEKENFTRFLVLGKKQDIVEEHCEYKTSLIFKINNISSSLYQALGAFANNGVNLLKIESYIPLKKRDESHFHIDVDGSPSDQSLKRALIALRACVQELKILGTYEKAYN